MTKNIDHICQKSIFEHAICSFVPQILQCRCVCVRLRTEHTQADRGIQGGSNDNEEKTIHNRASAVHGAHDGTVGGVSHSEAAWAESGKAPSSVKVAGVEMTNTDVTYYKNGGTNGSANDYNAMYNPSENTLTLKGVAYSSWGTRVWSK